jgi:GNAT superfamily N-acetyltransferase
VDSVEDVTFARELPAEDELLALYAAVNDRRVRTPALLTAAAAASTVVECARVQGRLVGLARALCDGHTTLYLCDLMVAPPHQHRGIGSELVRRVLALYPHVGQVVLLTDPPTVPFYERLGFRLWPAAMVVMR